MIRTRITYIHPVLKLVKLSTSSFRPFQHSTSANVYLYVERMFSKMHNFICRCKIYGCEERFNDTSWLQYAIPTNTIKNRPESCKRYAYYNVSSFQCLPEQFSNITVPCESYVYEEGESFVKEVIRTFLYSYSDLPWLYPGVK